MRCELRILIVLLLLATGALATEKPTVTFDISDLDINKADFPIRYAEYGQVSVGRNLTLPAASFLIELNFGETINSLVSIPDMIIPAGMLRIRPLPDMPTNSESERYEMSAMLPPDIARIGSRPLYVSGQLTKGNTRYADVMLFPATVDSSGHVSFTPSLDIYIGRRHITPEELITRETIVAGHLTRTHGRAGLDGETARFDYVIITSQALAESFQALARFKSETGYMTEIRLIEDIIADYAGRDDAEKLREYLKEFHAAGGRFVLLGGDEAILPVRYAYPYNTYSVPSLNYQQICDLYFTDLTGEWDVDNDGVWGEPSHDQPDIIPELCVGRLPFSQPEEVERYTHKLITYETTPGRDNREYLTRAFFFSSDQMRDHGGAGQHNQIAQAFPSHFLIDTVSGVEQPRGDDPAPNNLPANALEDVLSEGYGIVNIIAHGGNSIFCVRTSAYNDWPKSLFTTDAGNTSHGDIRDLTPNGKSALYYSLACSNGAFDTEHISTSKTSPNMAQTILALESAGAVAFVANSRWGWVNSSYLLQKAFFDSLFAHPNRPAVVAMYASKAAYYYYRDIVYGQNFYGDPTLRVYTDIPAALSLSLADEGGNLAVHVRSGPKAVEDCDVVVSLDGTILERHITDGKGRIVLDHDLSYGENYVICAVKAGCSIGRTDYTPSIAAAVDDEDNIVPDGFSLGQNYPNPFNPSTTISFHLPRLSHVRFTIYNILGQTACILMDQVLPGGHHSIEWNGRNAYDIDAASGVYFYRIEADTFTDVKKMVLIR